MIVDANGVYWFTDPPSYGPNGLMMSTVGSASVMDGFSTGGEFHGADALSLAPPALSGGTLTLTGTLTGFCYPEGTTASGEEYYTCTPTGSSSAFSWSWQGTLATPPTARPISEFTGSWQTIWGSVLTVNLDGTFMLVDDSMAYGWTSTDCEYDGKITQVDPSVGIYSVTATVKQATSKAAIASGYPCQAVGSTAEGVFILLPGGQLAGGLGAKGAVASLSTTVHN
jgi:hypothetical protein